MKLLIAWLTFAFFIKLNSTIVSQCTTFMHGSNRIEKSRACENEVQWSSLSRLHDDDSKTCAEHRLMDFNSVMQFEDVRQHILMYL